MMQGQPHRLRLRPRRIEASGCEGRDQGGRGAHPACAYRHGDHSRLDQARGIVDGELQRFSADATFVVVPAAGDAMSDAIDAARLLVSMSKYLPGFLHW